MTPDWIIVSPRHSSQRMLVQVQHIETILPEEKRTKNPGSILQFLSDQDGVMGCHVLESFEEMCKKVGFLNKDGTLNEGADG